jgi:hypothetical protein
MLRSKWLGGRYIASPFHTPLANDCTMMINGTYVIMIVERIGTARTRQQAPGRGTAR